MSVAKLKAISFPFRFSSSGQSLFTDYSITHSVDSLRKPASLQTIKFEWLGGRDSNPDSQIQSLVSYHWTTSQQRTRIYVSRPANVNRVVVSRAIV